MIYVKSFEKFRAIHASWAIAQFALCAESSTLRCESRDSRSYSLPLRFLRLAIYFSRVDSKSRRTRLSLRVRGTKTFGLSSGRELDHVFFS